MLRAAAILRLSSPRKELLSIHCAIRSTRLAADRAATMPKRTTGSTATTAAKGTRQPFSASAPLRILFCGRDMHFGYEYTREALQDDDDIEVVQCDRDDAARLLRGFHVAVPLMTRLDAAALSAAGPVPSGGGPGGGELALVLQFGVGLEGVDLVAAMRAGVACSNIPSTVVPNALSCAEMSIFLALAALRRAPELAASIRAGRLGAPPGRTLWGKRALLIGFGAIGRALAPRLRALGVEVDAVRRSEWEEQEDEWEEEDGEATGGKRKRGGGGGGGSSGVCPPAPPASSSPSPSSSSSSSSPYSLPDYDVPPRVASRSLSRTGEWHADLLPFAAAADLAFVCCAETADTRGVVGARFWASAKPGLVLVNVARGGLVDPAAALAALESGRAGALALDVQWEEPVDVLGGDFRALCSHERVVLTPHVAGVTQESYRGMAEVVATAARRMAREGLLPDRVLNAPVAGH